MNFLADYLMYIQGFSWRHPPKEKVIK